MIWRWWVERRARRGKSVLAWRAIAQTSDEAALSHPDGRSRRARLTRPGFEVADRDRVAIARPARRRSDLVVVDARPRWRAEADG